MRPKYNCLDCKYRPNYSIREKDCCPRYFKVVINEIGETCLHYTWDTKKITLTDRIRSWFKG